MIAFTRQTVQRETQPTNPHSMPVTFAQYSIAFGVVSLLFGFLGFVRAKSKASLIAGGVSGILLIVGGLMDQLGHKSGFYLALIVSGLLLLRFLPSFLKTKKLYPSGILAILALIGVIMGVKGLL